MQQIEQYIEDSGVVTLTMNRPEAMNALTPDMFSDLIAYFSALAEDERCKIIVLTGAGKAFTAGVDLKSLNAIAPKNGRVGDQVDVPGRQLTQLISRTAKPVIAKVNGFCFTGGLELALACDLIYCADEAKLGDTHTKWGLRPSWGMSQRLPRRVGVLKAKEMSYTAAFYSGQQAAAMGLCNASVPREQLDDIVAKVCGDILGNSIQALAAYKDLYEQTDGKPLMDGLRYEWASNYVIDDTVELLKDFIKR